MGTISGLRPMFLLGHHSLTPEDPAGSSCGPHRNQGNAKSWKIHHREQMLCSQPKAREKFHLTLLQTRFQVTWSHRDRPNTCKSKGEDRHVGNICQRCGSSQGRTLAKETLWRQHWSPSERQVSGLGTSSPGENVRTWRSNAGPLERRVMGTPNWENSEQHPSQVAGAPLT